MENFRVCLFFFFQAEDGIRHLTVTGVQTCALPILSRPKWSTRTMARRKTWIGWRRRRLTCAARSEERRVGKECRSRWWAYHEKKKTATERALCSDVRGEASLGAKIDTVAAL